MAISAPPWGSRTLNKDLKQSKFAETIKIIQHNVLAWTINRRYELYNIYRLSDPDIILINSHGCVEDYKIKLFGYKVYQKNCYNQLQDGIAIAVKSNLQHTVLDNYDENYIAIQIQTSLGPTLIATGYQPPRRPIIPLQSLLQIFRRNIPVIFLGDLNARHPILGHNNTNNAGDSVATLLRRGTVQHHGPDFKTYMNPRAVGTPDIILTNDHIVHNMHVTAGPLTSSDHLPIILTLSAAPIQVPTTPRLDKGRANWTQFEDNLKDYTTPELDGRPTTDIDKELEKWYMATDRAIDNNIPTTKYRTLPHPNISNDTRTALRTYNTVRRHAEINGWTQVSRNMIKTLQNNLQQEFCQLQKDNWNQLITSIDSQHNEPEKFWSGIKRLMGSDRQQLKYLIDSNGRKLTTEREQALEFQRVWSNIYKITEGENENFCADTENFVRTYLNNSHNHCPYDTIDLDRLRPNNNLTKPFTHNDILNKIRKLKKRKAPGHSRIDKEIIIHLPLNMIKALTAIFNASLSAGYFPALFKLAILKLVLKSGKNPTDSINYRPISLLDIAGKVYERLINDRLRRFLEDTQRYHPRQHAYRRNRGTFSAIALAYETIATHQQDRTQCNVIFRDVSKAFDKVWHDGLRYKLCTLNMPRIFTALLCNFLQDRKATIQVGNYKTDTFPLLCGVPQGSTIAPSLYTIYTSDIGEIPNCTYFTYADDVTQVVTYAGKSKQYLKRHTERAITSLNRYEQQWKIKTNPNKFRILHISKRLPLPITINNSNIEFTTTAKLLGLTLKKSGISAHVKETKTKASAALKKLKKFSKLRPQTKLHLYKAFVLPTLEYPTIPLNTISTSNWQSLQTVQNKALRWIDGATPPYSTTVNDLHDRYNMQPLNIRNFQTAHSAWEKMRTHLAADVQQLTEIETAGSHSWWPLSYLPEEAREPPPIFTS